MRFAVALLIGCLLSLLGQNATSCETWERENSSSSIFDQIDSKSRIYFQSIRDENLIIGPAIRSNGIIKIYLINENDKFTSKSIEKTYIVTKNGVLIPKLGIPNDAIYTSRKPIFYMKGFKDILIPLNILYTKSQQEKRIKEANDDFPENHDLSFENELKKMGKIKKFNDTSKIKYFPKKSNQSGLIGKLSPDKNCNGEITIFLLKNNGIMKRMPPDPYLPNGINLSYSMKDNFLIRPKMTKLLDDSIIMNYITSENGDLIPDLNNKFKLNSENGKVIPFILGDCGSLIPVREEIDDENQISYSYRDQVIYKGDQFPEIFSNSEFILINNQKYKLPMKKEKIHHNIRKRSLYSDEYNHGYFPPSVRQIVQEVPATQRKIIRQNTLPPVITRPPQTIVVREQPPPPPSSSVRRVNYEPPRSTPVVPSDPPIIRVPIKEISMQQRISTPPIQRVSIPQREIPLQQLVRVPAIPQREIQVRVPISEPEINVIPPTKIIQTQSRSIPAEDIHFTNDDGEKICLEPEFTEQNDVILYKLTCKGNLVRFPSCKEPEYDFPIHFKIYLEEFIMIPVADNNNNNNNCDIHITYILQENGDLIPCESNKNTFKKAPGSLLYFMLGKDNILFPVQQKVNPDGCISYYYQDKFLLKLTNTANKPLHFSTLGRPLFAYYNGLTVMTNSSKPRLNSCRGSNWKNHCSRMGESESKDIFLAGPCGQLIRVTPYKTKSGSTVIYEMDANGILYRSPKDKKRCIILKSYIILKEGILLPSNETTGYMFMSSKNGDMFPYLYPQGKLEAPQGESIKYLLCEKGILLPMELEIVNNQICYFFLDVIVYKEKVYTKSDLDNLSESNFKLHYKNECDDMMKQKDGLSICSGGQFKPYITKDGSIVYYEKYENLLKRHPIDVVPKYLSYTTGSFEIQSDGSLFQIRYQDPDNDVINLMLEPNGDLMEDCRNIRKPSFNYYILDVNGNLIAVEGRKTKKNIYFYKNNIKICRASITKMNLITNDHSEMDRKKTPLGLDPLRLMEEPEPENDDYGPMCIPVPLKSVSLPDNGKERGKCEKKKKKGGDDDDDDDDESEEVENKEESCKETMALELEINDEVIEEIRNWANKCDKMLSRREVEESLTEALQGLNVAALLKENPETT